jgi:hypothetical protein
MEIQINYLRQYFSPFLHPYKLIHRFLLLKKLDADIVFVASPADVQTPHGNLFIPDKFQAIIRTAHQESLSSLEVFHLFSKSGRYERKSNFIRLELVLLLIFLSNPIRWISDTKKVFRGISKLGQITFRQRIRFAYWGYLFSKIKPKLIFGVGMDQILIASANVQGIKTVEVMHGLFAKGRSPFSFIIKEGDFKPDLFLSWHDDFTKMVSELGVEAITIGYPNLLATGWNLDYREEGPEISLITLSWGLKDAVDPFGVMSHELHKYLTSLNEARLRFRVHPVVCQSGRETLGVSDWIKHEFPGSKISLPYEESLWEALANCSHHITHESSTFFEASLVGIPTLFMNRGGKSSTHIPNELIEFGLVFFDKDSVGHASPMNKELGKRIIFEANFNREMVIGLFKEAGLID